MPHALEIVEFNGCGHMWSLVGLYGISVLVVNVILFELYLVP